MPRLRPRWILAFLAPALLAGCQVFAPGAAPPAVGDVTANAVTGDAIEVTSLDTPTAGDAPATSAPPGAAGIAAPEQRESPPAAEPAPSPAPAPTSAAETEEPPPPEAKSERQIACEKDGGSWMRAGGGEIRVCIYSTRDAGKRCTRESDCEGLCLARSGTCAPVRPLLGCNEILQDNGARVTQCIE